AGREPRPLVLPEGGCPEDLPVAGHRRRRGQFSAEEGGQEEALLPRRGGFEPARRRKGLTRLVPDRSAETSQEHGEAGADHLEPLLLPLEPIIVVSGPDGVMPPTRIHPRRRDADGGQV